MAQNLTEVETSDPGVVEEAYHAAIRNLTWKQIERVWNGALLPEEQESPLMIHARKCYLEWRKVASSLRDDKFRKRIISSISGQR